MKTLTEHLNNVIYPFQLKIGNTTYTEYESGFWILNTLDERGNQVYVENSGGLREIRQFDNENREILFLSKGVRIIKEYDSNGKLIRNEKIDL